MTKFYVVSEEELCELQYQAIGLGQSRESYSEELFQASEACRAREVELIGGGMYQLTDWDFQGDLKDE